MSITKDIITFVTTDKEHVLMSGKPVIYAKDEEELQAISSALGKILGGNVHRLINGLVVIVEV